jgi:hypothetical protein
MILNTSSYSVSLVQSGITYNGTLGFWESATSFSSIGNSTVIHDYAAFGKLAYTSSPGAYPTGYDPDLFYYGFSYVHYTPVAYGNQPSYIVRFGLASSLEDAMERTPIIFADGGSGNLQFKTYGKFIKLVTPVPECCDLPYFNEGQPLLQLYPGSSSFDPEGLNEYNPLYGNAVALHSQVGQDKIKKKVSFTCSVTRNGLPVVNGAPGSITHTEAEISEVVSWINTTQDLYLESDSGGLSYIQQGFSSVGSIPITPARLSYANGRRKTKSQNYLFSPYAEYFIENQKINSGFSVYFGDLSSFMAPRPNKILYRLLITGQFHNINTSSFEGRKDIHLQYELEETLGVINISRLSGTKTLNLIAETDTNLNYYIDNIPSTVTVTFSDDDYSAEVLPATLTLVSPEKYLQDPCRVVGSYFGIGSLNHINGLRTIDGVSLADGDRVLIISTDAWFGFDNGVWIVHSGDWTRPANWNLKNSYFSILEGTGIGRKYYLVNSTNLGSLHSQFGVFPSEHNWTVNNYTDELPNSITLNKVAGYNNYEAEFTTAVNVRNYIRLKLIEKGPTQSDLFYGAENYSGFSFQQWTPDLTGGPYSSRYQNSEANIIFFNEAVHIADSEADGSLFYSAPATVKMLPSYSGLITIRLFKMAATNNGSSTASENSLTVQYLLDWPLAITPPPPS